ncbi:GDSL-type esterase/lipase family protein [Streptomyces virginiae]
MTACTPAVSDSSPPSTPPPVLRVMPLGDSITSGYRSTTGAGYRSRLWDRTTGQSRYRIDLVGTLHSGVLPDADHDGHDGYAIAQIRAGIDGWLMAAQPDVIILGVGVNDLDRGTDPAVAANQLAGLVDRIHARQPHARVLLVGVIPTTGGLRDQVAAYNARAASLGRPWVRYISAPALETGEMADRVHPSDAGYQRLGDAIYVALDQVI